jgi:hypothetical protein
MKVNKPALLVIALSLSMSFSAFAQDATAKGEVKKIDEAAGKITLNHGRPPPPTSNPIKQSQRVQEAAA